jgi:DNA polymerase-1
MRIINTATLDTKSLNRDDALYIYNGLDCCITYEVLEALLPQLTSVTQGTYNFSRSLQGPLLEMNARGVLMDKHRRDEVLLSYRQDVNRLAEQLNAIIRDGIGFDFEITKNRKNPYPSDQQLQDLFFNVMGLPVQYQRGANGERRPTVNRDALEKLEHYFYAEPIIKHLLALRDIGKKISFLSTSVDGDGRLRTSFNIAGTTTGRLASSYSDFGTGTNLQNVENKLRSVFIADPGYKFCNIDLEQSDSRAVGAIHWNLFRDSNYLDACESGDLHTSVSRIAFRHLNFTGSLADDKRIAGDKFYREFSYRDASKRLGHGTNYQGQPDKMSRATHIPIGDIIRFQKEYLGAFPAFKLWWQWVEDQIKHVQKLTTFLGRQRHFFGHWRDSETIRQAIAYEPQSVTADTIDRALLQVWWTDQVQLLLQVHDSILFQFPEDREDEIVPRMLKIVEQTVLLKEDRPFTIPAEAKTGWNWSDDSSDPDSLRKFKGHDDRRRVRDPSKSYSRFDLLGVK